jgi:hypothetical protein
MGVSIKIGIKQIRNFQMYVEQREAPSKTGVSEDSLESSPIVGN